MFLSRVEIPWRLVRNPYDLHRQLWKLFPGEEKESRRNENEKRQGFLFRIEDQLPRSSMRLLVQSRRPPLATSNLSIINTREFNPKPVKGQQLAFILTANPVKTIHDKKLAEKPNKSSPKCRVPLIREEEQRKWLIQKLEDVGQVQTTNVLPHPPLFFRKGNQAGKLIAITFEGFLTVKDPTLLLVLLENGIGPAKAFGCGLMLVRRI